MASLLPLFLTSLSLSSKTAFGVQTKLLLEQFPESHHLYWDASEFRGLDKRSSRIESALCARFSILRGEPQSLRARAISVLGRSWWSGNALKPKAAKWLMKRYAGAVSVVYAAPCSARDSERMKSILSRLNRPFVLHLWDIQDRNQIDCAAFKWLLENALHVLCLTDEMIHYIAPVRQGSSIMRFTRKPSESFASAPADRTLRIALIGNCRRYRDGLDVLNQALRIAKKQNLNATIVYLGTGKSLKNTGVRLAGEVEVTGFVKSDWKRDLILSHCHVGFLPGPLASPSTNMFSRFSIPSRILDYMATGLPIAATVHADSATFGYMKHLGIEDCASADAESLAGKLIALAQAGIWRAYSKRSQDAFLTAREEKNPLKDYLALDSPFQPVEFSR